jgi:hypothetical protein
VAVIIVEHTFRQQALRHIVSKAVATRIWTLQVSVPVTVIMPKNINNKTHLPNLTDARTEYSDAISDDTVRLALPRIIPDVVDNITGEAKLQVRPFRRCSL